MKFILKLLPPQVLAIALLGSTSLLRADVVPASLFCDHAVLQQGMPLPIWGSADEGEQVTVSLAGQTATTIARQGRWSVRLGALPAGGPHILRITGNNRIEISDVLVGEVWICSGQSNMERQLGLRSGQKPIKDWQTEAQSADYPMIRHFGVAQHLALSAQARAEGKWQVCTPATAPDFSAVGFFFGRALHLARGTPVGLVHSSWGGTPSEAWTSREGLAGIPEMADTLARLDSFRRDPVAGRASYERDLEAWFEANDPGSGSGKWNTEGFDISGWPLMQLPAFWEDSALPGFDGVVWLRREIDVPADWCGQEVALHLGAIDDLDSTWVNGRFVGTTSGWTAPRVYRLAPGVLKPGRNTLAVRVLDTGGGGGLWGGSDPMRLASVADPSRSIKLDGGWSYRVSVVAQKAVTPPKDPTLSSSSPAGLYNGMIAPLQPYAMRGVIWYQGEANASNPSLYRRLFPALVADWRRGWAQGDFPFLYVQIAPFNGMPPEIREAQRLSLARIPNSAMTVTLDVGDAEDIHPADKRPVGERLALSARALAYGEKLEYSGPLFQALRTDGKLAVLTFTHVGGGLAAKGDSLTGFTIAGEDKVFHPAQARIVGDTVEVFSDKVKAPRAVRYAWANVPEGNLFNRDGLPASPFATDDE